MREEEARPLSLQISASPRTRELTKGRVKIVVQAVGGKGPYDYRLQIAGPGDYFKKAGQDDVNGPFNAIWGSPVQQPGQYGIKARVRGSDGALSGWSGWLPVTVTAPKPQRIQEPAPSKYQPGPNGKCQYQAMGAWDGASVPANSQGEEKDGPAAASYKLTLPGPGTLRVTLGSTGGHQMSNHEYGSCRGAARARLYSAKSVMGNHWVRGGKYYMGVRTYDENSYSWEVKGPGKLTIKVFGENCPALKKKPSKCRCFGMGAEQGILWLPTSYKLKAEFKCSPRKKKK